MTSGPVERGGEQPPIRDQPEEGQKKSKKQKKPPHQLRKVVEEFLPEEVQEGKHAQDALEVKNVLKDNEVLYQKLVEYQDENNEAPSAEEMAEIAWKMGLFKPENKDQALKNIQYAIDEGGYEVWVEPLRAIIESGDPEFDIGKFFKEKKVVNEYTKEILKKIRGMWEKEQRDAKAALKSLGKSVENTFPFERIASFLSKPNITKDQFKFLKIISRKKNSLEELVDPNNYKDTKAWLEKGPPDGEFRVNWYAKFFVVRSLDDNENFTKCKEAYQILNEKVSDEELPSVLKEVDRLLKIELQQHKELQKSELGEWYMDPETNNIVQTKVNVDKLIEGFKYLPVLTFISTMSPLQRKRLIQAADVLDIDKKIVFRFDESEDAFTFSYVERKKGFWHSFVRLFRTSKESLQTMDAIFDHLELMVQESPESAKKALEVYKQVARSKWGRDVMNTRSPYLRGKGKYFNRRAKFLCDAFEKLDKLKGTNLIKDQCVEDLEEIVAADSRNLRAYYYIASQTKNGAYYSWLEEKLDKKEKGCTNLTENEVSLFNEKFDVEVKNRQAEKMRSLEYAVSKLGENQKIIGSYTSQNYFVFEVVDGAFDPKIKEDREAAEDVRKIIQDLKKPKPQLANQLLQKIRGTPWGKAAIPIDPSLKNEIARIQAVEKARELSQALQEEKYAEIKKFEWTDPEDFSALVQIVKEGDTDAIALLLCQENSLENGDVKQAILECVRKSERDPTEIFKEVQERVSKISDKDTKLEIQKVFGVKNLLYLHEMFLLHQMKDNLSEQEYVNRVFAFNEEHAAQHFKGPFARRNTERVSALKEGFKKEVAMLAGKNIDDIIAHNQRKKGFDEWFYREEEEKSPLDSALMYFKRHVIEDPDHFEHHLLMLEVRGQVNVSELLDNYRKEERNIPEALAKKIEAYLEPQEDVEAKEEVLHNQSFYKEKLTQAGKQMRDLKKKIDAEGDQKQKNKLIRSYLVLAKASKPTQVYEQLLNLYVEEKNRSAMTKSVDKKIKELADLEKKWVKDLPEIHAIMGEENITDEQYEKIRGFLKSIDSSNSFSAIAFLKHLIIDEGKKDLTPILLTILHQVNDYEFTGWVFEEVQKSRSFIDQMIAHQGEKKGRGLFQALKVKFEKAVKSAQVEVKEEGAASEFVEKARHMLSGEIRKKTRELKNSLSKNSTLDDVVDFLVYRCFLPDGPKWEEYERQLQRISGIIKFKETDAEITEKVMEKFNVEYQQLESRRSTLVRKLQQKDQKVEAKEEVLSLDEFREKISSAKNNALQLNAELIGGAKEEEIDIEEGKKFLQEKLPWIVNSNLYKDPKSDLARGVGLLVYTVLFGEGVEKPDEFSFDGLDDIELVREEVEEVEVEEEEEVKAPSSLDEFEKELESKDRFDKARLESAYKSLKAVTDPILKKRAKSLRKEVEKDRFVYDLVSTDDEKRKNLLGVYRWMMTRAELNERLALISSISEDFKQKADSILNKVASDPFLHGFEGDEVKGEEVPRPSIDPANDTTYDDVFGKQDFSDENAKALAHDMQVILHNALRGITLKEIVGKFRKEEAPHLDTATKIVDGFQVMLTVRILKAESDEERKKVIDFLLKVQEESLKIKDYSTAAIILRAFNSSPVSRLLNDDLKNRMNIHRKTIIDNTNKGDHRSNPLRNFAQAYSNTTQKFNDKDAFINPDGSFNERSAEVLVKIFSNFSSLHALEANNPSRNLLKNILDFNNGVIGEVKSSKELVLNNIEGYYERLSFNAKHYRTEVTFSGMLTIHDIWEVLHKLGKEEKPKIRHKDKKDEDSALIFRVGHLNVKDKLGQVDEKLVKVVRKVLDRVNTIDKFLGVEEEGATKFIAASPELMVHTLLKGKDILYTLSANKFMKRAIDSDNSLKRKCENVKKKYKNVLFKFLETATDQHFNQLTQPLKALAEEGDLKACKLLAKRLFRSDKIEAAYYMRKIPEGQRQDLPKELTSMTINDDQLQTIVSLQRCLEGSLKENERLVVVKKEGIDIVQIKNKPKNLENEVNDFKELLQVIKIQTTIGKDPVGALSNLSKYLDSKGGKQLRKRYMELPFGIYLTLIGCFDLLPRGSSERRFFMQKFKDDLLNPMVGLQRQYPALHNEINQSEADRELEGYLRELSDKITDLESEDASYIDEYAQFVEHNQADLELAAQKIKENPKDFSGLLILSAFNDYTKNVDEAQFEVAKNNPQLVRRLAGELVTYYKDNDKEDLANIYQAISNKMIEFLPKKRKALPPTPPEMK